MGDPDELRLTAGDAAIELGVAEEARTSALVAVLGRLALREESPVAHPAVTAGDVERDDDSVARRQVRNAGADLLDDAHELVAEDVALVQVRREHPVEVEVGSADR